MEVAGAEVSLVCAPCSHQSDVRLFPVADAGSVSTGPLNSLWEAVYRGRESMPLALQSIWYEHLSEPDADSNYSESMMSPLSSRFRRPCGSRWHNPLAAAHNLLAQRLHSAGAGATFNATQVNESIEFILKVKVLTSIRKIILL